MLRPSPATGCCQTESRIDLDFRQSVDLDRSASLPEKMDVIVHPRARQGHRSFRSTPGTCRETSAMAFPEYARRRRQIFIYASSTNVYRRSHELLDEAAR